MPSEPKIPCMMTLSVVLPADMAEEVRRLAEADRRSVSSWLRILIEREIQSAKG